MYFRLFHFVFAALHAAAVGHHLVRLARGDPDENRR
jgi:hypothetical protein